MSAARGFGRVEEEDESTDDPEEIAYRERLRRLAEEEEESVVSDPFGLDIGTRQTAASTFAGEDKLSLDAQRAMDMIRRTSMAVTEDEITNGRPSIWTDAGTEDEADEATLRVQQARLKALAAAAQPASHVRTQLTRSAMPKPPGLADKDKIRQLQERQNRLSMAETAAVVAATGVRPEEIKPHIDQVMRAKVGVIERVHGDTTPSPPSKPVVAPPPGLAAPPPGFNRLEKPLPPPPPPSIAAKRASVAAPPGLGAAEAPKPEEPAAPPPLPQSRKSTVATPHASLDVGAEKARRVQSLDASKALEKKSSSLPTAKENAKVVLYGSVSASRPLLDILSWRAPGLAVSWMLFAGFFVLALMSKKWSSLTVWALFALFRVAAIRLNGTLQRLLPARLAQHVTIQQELYLPGSLAFAGEVAALLFNAGREVMAAVLNVDSRWAGALLVALILGIKMNLALVAVLATFLISMVAAAYVALPRAFEPLAARAPLVGEILSKF
jgi:hypothetical protein